MQLKWEIEGKSIKGKIYLEGKGEWDWDFKGYEVIDEALRRVEAFLLCAFTYYLRSRYSKFFILSFWYKAVLKPKCFLNVPTILYFLEKGAQPARTIHDTSKKTGVFTNLVLHLIKQHSTNEIQKRGCG